MILLKNKEYFYSKVGLYLLARIKFLNKSIQLICNFLDKIDRIILEKN